ncbi:beta-1,6-N-acetylglucosaminyltransferase [Ruminococcus flavefaciens]|uniref:Peptide O-xylosyltransferase n=1 Tax=Ruminococcus flavefaciens TaxID=1265 RepID=A0A315Y630_RUMFL|nr:beta-1,6-N-acetylglucosaminyltransferase [Ruminococcus flavefaciens]PWJ14695.1 core-2/I-Branching enzyme [Ruminococcus flavefaciens]SSA42725.1 Core-2/I-Branching enzyme [Ruminococcus flavefaciens]
MKIAILLLCHKNPDQINLFIKQMRNKSIDIFVHVDKKSNIVENIVKADNVYILPEEKRVDVAWASISQIEATHNLIISARSINNYDYYWLCSGQDFPLKSCQDILAFLSTNKNLNYLNFFTSRQNGLDKDNNYDKRNSIFYFDFLMGREKWKRIFRRCYVALTGGYNYTFPWLKRKYKGFKFYFGSQWWCINKDTMNWIIEYEKNNNDYFTYYSHCSTPDESYYHTLVMNSPYAKDCTDYLHCIVWPEGSPSPKILTIDDKALLFNTSYLMARKFDINIDSEIVRVLSDRIKEC